MKLEKDQVAIVTGAASGLGFALCEELANRGVRLVLADVNIEGAQTKAAQLGGITDAVPCHCDVALRSEVDALRDFALQRFGRIDLVFSNAGVPLTFRPMWEHPVEDWDWLLGVNLQGVINGIRTFIPYFVEKGSGHLINTASMAGMTILPFNGVYNASRHATVSLSETLSAELRQRAPGVRASVVCPGMMATHDHRRGTMHGISQEEVGAGLEKFEISAAEAAARVIEGVEADKIYIFTNPGARERVQARFDAVLAAFEPIPQR